MLLLLLLLLVLFGYDDNDDDDDAGRGVGFNDDASSVLSFLRLGGWSPPPPLFPAPCPC